MIGSSFILRLRVENVVCVALQVRSSWYPSEDSSACCAESFMATASVQKSMSPRTLTTRSIRFGTQ